MNGLNKSEVQLVIKDRMGKKIDKTHPWISYFNVLIFTLLVICALVSLYGFVESSFNPDIKGLEPQYTLTIKSDQGPVNEQAYTDGKYLMVGDTVYGESVYQLTNGDIIHKNSGNLLDSNKNVIATSDQSTSDGDRFLRMGILALILTFAVWFLVFFWWLDKRESETIKALRDWEKTGNLPLVLENNSRALEVKE